jgi:hypothetical protein
MATPSPDRRSSPASCGPERNSTNSAPGYQAADNEDLSAAADVSMPDFFESSGTTEFFTPESSKLKMRAVWHLPADASDPTNDHVPEPDPPEADIDTVNVIDPTSTIFIATTIIIASIVSSKFYITPRPPAVDESSGMIARIIIQEIIRNVDKDVAVVKANRQKVQNRLKKARASLAAKHHTAEKELKLLKTIDKLEFDVKQTKKALFEQFCRRRAWGERLDRVNLLDESG